VGVKIDSNGDSAQAYALRMVVRARCFTVVFSGIVNVYVTKTLIRAVLVVQIESIKSPPARSANGVISR